MAGSDDDRPTSGDMGNIGREPSQHAAGNGKQGSVHTQEQRVKDAITVAGEKMQVSSFCMHALQEGHCVLAVACTLCIADTWPASQLQQAKRATRALPI